MAKKTKNAAELGRSRIDAARRQQVNHHNKRVARMNLSAIDMQSLTKGSVISTADVEACTGLSLRSEYFNVAIQEMKNAVQSDIISRGLMAKVIVVGNAIAILSDADADEYLSQQFELLSSTKVDFGDEQQFLTFMENLRHAHRERLSLVDASGFDALQRECRERGIYTQSISLAAFRKASGRAAIFGFDPA